MADNVEDNDVVGVEDIMAVRSRISWGAILAGAVVGVATLLVLGVLGGAIGLSSTNEVDRDTLAAGAALWALITSVVAMFLAGWITSQTAVGENNREAIIHGIIAWAVVLGICFWLAAGGIGAGLRTITGIAQAGAAGAGEVDWQEGARRAGISQETLDQWRARADQRAAALNDPANQEELQEQATNATWWTFASMVLSLASAIFGAILGAGPSFTLVPVAGTGSYTVRQRRYATTTK
jgi:hypothetical protein